jgi:hypothetical protein
MNPAMARSEGEDLTMSKKYAKAVRTGAAFLGLLMPCGLLAQTIVIEAHSAGNNNNLYSEVSGMWGDVRDKSRARGLSPLALSRSLMSPGEGGVVEFRPRIDRSGRYTVEMTWPNNANATGLSMAVRSATENSTVAVNLDPARANDWHQLGTFEFDSGDDVRIQLTVPPGVQGTDPARESAVILDAIRMRYQAERSSTTGVGAQAPRNPFEGVATGQNPSGIPGVVGGGGGVTPVGSQLSDVSSADGNPFAEAGRPGSSLFDSDAEFSPSAGIEVLPVEGSSAPVPPPTGGATAAGNPFAGAASNPFASAPAGNPFDAAAPPIGGAAPSASGSPGTANPFDSAPPPGDLFGSSDEFGDYAPAAPGMDSAPGSAPGGFAAPPPGGSAPAASPFGSAAAPARPAPTRAEDATRPFDTGSANFGASGRTENRTLFAVDPVGAAPAAVEQAPESSIPWEYSLDAAIAKAKSADKPILLVFFGDDKVTEDFENGVLDSADVQAELEAFIPVELDFAIDNAVAAKFNVPRAPYAVVLNKFGFTKGHVPNVQDGRRMARELRRLR